jgi:NADPH:quinone reductase
VTRSSSFTLGSRSRPASTEWPTIARIGSIAAQSFTCMPARTCPPRSQNAVNTAWSARPDDEDDVRANGAAEFVSGPDVGVAVRDLLPAGADGLVDAAQVGAAALAAVRDGGSFVAVTDPSEPPAERDITVATVHVHHDAAQQAALVRLVERGTLRLRVAATYALDDAAKAHEAAAQPGLRGRVVLTV